MVILQVSTSDSGGGAEGIACNLLEAYQAMGESSWLAVGEKKTSSPRVVEIPNLARRSWWTRISLVATSPAKHGSGKPYRVGASTECGCGWRSNPVSELLERI